jgi:hypothetical protein
VGAFDESGHIANGDPGVVRVVDDADLGVQRGKGVGGDAGASSRNGGEQGRFSRVGIADESNLREKSQFEPEMAFFARFTGLSEAWGLAGGGGEIAVTESAASTTTENVLLAVVGEIGDKLSPHGIREMRRRRGWRRILGWPAGVTEGGALRSGDAVWNRCIGGRVWTGARGFGLGLEDPPDESAAGDFNEEVRAGVTVHTLAETWFTALSEQTRLEVLGDEVVEIVIGLEDDIAAAPAIAAARAALGAIRFTQKRHAPFAAMAGAGEDLDFVNEHNK